MIIHNNNYISKKKKKQLHLKQNNMKFISKYNT